MIAVVAADSEEVKDYLVEGNFQVAHGEPVPRFYKSLSVRDVVIVEGGIGKEQAERATQEVIKRYAPEFIISAGFAGAVQPGLKAGDLFVCDRVWSIEGSPLHWKPDEAASRALLDTASKETLTGEIAGLAQEHSYCGCLSVDLLVSNKSLKGWIGANFPVHIVDMESYWVSQMASEYAIPHLVLRSVLDPMEQTLPEFVEQAVAGQGQRNWMRALSYVLARPIETPRLLHLSRQTKLARTSLASLLRALTLNRGWFPAFQAA